MSTHISLSTLKRKELESIVSKRNGEKKLGETIELLSSLDDLNSSKSKFVLLGIPEDIGPRANHGNGGAHCAFSPFLSKFLNMQSNKFLSGEQISVLGTIEIDSKHQSGDILGLRKVVDEIDDVVFPIIKQIVSLGKCPIVIGGGHNNCYPIIKGCALSKESPVNCINIDPHADLRKREGRHSGNGFSYAIENGYLNKYGIVGLHEQYNSDYIWEEISSKEQIVYSSFEDFLNGVQLITPEILSVSETPFGLELDLDAIQNMPSSAFTPSGIPINLARRMIIRFAKEQPLYLHLPEGAPLTANEENIVGKGLAYIVADFIKNYN